MRGIVEQIDCVHLIQTDWDFVLAAELSRDSAFGCAPAVVGFCYRVRCGWTVAYSRTLRTTAAALLDGGKPRQTDPRGLQLCVLVWSE